MVLSGPITDQTRGATIEEPDINFESLHVDNNLSGSLQTVKGAASDSDSGLKIATTGIATDNISEKTSGSGVTVDGVLLKDSNVVANSNYLLEGYTSGRNVLRCITWTITGTTDETTFTSEIADNFNGEAIASETIDQDTPTGGTRFDTNSAGEYAQTKTLTKTVIAVMSATIRAQESGASYDANTFVTSNKIRLSFVKSNGNAVDLTNHGADLPNTKRLIVDLIYVTSD